MHSTSRRVVLSGLRATFRAETRINFHSTSTPFPSCTASALAVRTREDGYTNRFEQRHLLLPIQKPLGLPATGVRHSSTGVGEPPARDNSMTGTVEKPDDRLSQEVQDELRQLHHIRALVSQLYMALHVPDTYQTEVEALRKQLEEIRAELQPLEEKKIQLLMRAERRSKLLAWGGLGFMGMQFGFLARLTWWEYSWDIIEPVTYFVTYGTAMALYAYFLVTRQDITYQGVTERWTAVAFHKNVKRSKWEMNRYVQLKDKLTQIQAEVERMNLLLPHGVKPMATVQASHAKIVEKILS